MPGMAKDIAQITLSSPRRRFLILTTITLTWALTFLTLAHKSGPPPIRATTTTNPTTQEWLPVHNLTCTSSFWEPAACGINGATCDQHPSDKHIAFKCPANCARDGVVPGAAPPHLAGPFEIRDTPVVIGGPIYRGDSYVCPAAIHAGVITDETGGCGVVKFMGMTNSFPGSMGPDGVESLSVKTYFPQSFRFTLESDEMECPAAAGGKTGEGGDRQWALPVVSAAHTALVWRATRSSPVRTMWAMAVMYAHLRVRGGAGPLGVLTPGSTMFGQSGVASRDAGEEEDVPVPQILEPVLFRDTISNATFKWAEPVPEGVEGISMWVDDVERSRRYFGKGGTKRSVLGEGEQMDMFLWRRTPQAFVDYIRFGWIKDGKVLKYSQPGVWYTDGTWSGIPASPSS